MLWTPFIYGGETYDLSHLHPQEIVYIQPAQKNKPERKYVVEVHYSLHCFTRGIKDENQNEIDLYYSDPRETRLFDFKRYELSFKLPEIIKSLGERNCFHTNYTGFFTIEIVDSDGEKADYEIYFEVEKGKGKGLELYIHSAYVRDPERIKDRPKKKKIGFYIVLYKILTNQKIRKPI